MKTHTRILRCWLMVVSLGLTLSACATAAPQRCESEPPAGSPDTPASTYEQDRKAILALAGDYEVRFQFRETVPMRKGYELTKPYFSEATEIIEVLEDTGRRIDLQHILLVHGRVVKHWRQTWTYEPTVVYEFKGHRTWVPRAVSAAEGKGAWLQYVTQVDDSPRYSGIARWEHTSNMSSWESAAWRPLPRREYTVRSDYQVLVAKNRHTLTPEGWVHEQDNYKLVLDGEERSIIAREVGLNVYNRTTAVDFSKAREYWAATQEFWGDVRAFWADLMDGEQTVKLSGSWEDKKLYEHMFGLAADAQDNPGEREARQDRIRTIMDGFLLGADEAPDSGTSY